MKTEKKTVCIYKFATLHKYQLIHSTKIAYFDVANTNSLHILLRVLSLQTTSEKTKTNSLKTFKKK